MGLTYCFARLRGPASRDFWKLLFFSFSIRKKRVIRYGAIKCQKFMRLVHLETPQKIRGLFFCLILIKNILIVIYLKDDTCNVMQVLMRFDCSTDFLYLVLVTPFRVFSSHYTMCFYHSKNNTSKKLFML